MRLILIFACLVSTIIAHKGMIASGNFRDVGVVYTEPHFSGHGIYLMEVDDDHKCFALNPGPNGDPKDIEVGSMAICKPRICTFHMGDNCFDSKDKHFSVSAWGPADFLQVETPKGRTFKTYSCHKYGTAPMTDFTLVGSPHKKVMSGESQEDQNL